VFSSGCWLYSSAGVYGVKNKELEIHAFQINKVREQLNAPNIPINDIVKPKYMLTRVFVRRIKRLARHEKAFESKLEESLVNWLNKTYY
jgi:hypothetical protein